MGTSGAYTPSPNWSKIKTDVTNALNSGPVRDQEAHELISVFVDELCEQEDQGFGDVPSDFGSVSPEEATDKLNDLLKEFPKPPVRTGKVSARGASGGSGGGGSARSSAGKKPGRGTRGGKRTGRISIGGGIRPMAGRLATFISEVPKVGLRQALINAGFESVDDLPPEQIALAVADVLASESSLLIDTELRAALMTVLEAICQKPDSIEVAEERLSDSAYNLPGILQELFECYIMERFKTFLCEHEAPKHGFEAADKISAEARDYVAGEMELEKADRRDLTSVDWQGSEGAKILDAILERTIAVYTT